MPEVNSALRPSVVAKSSTSFGWGKGGNVTSAGWQVTLCDPMWHVSSRSGVATLRTAIHLLLLLTVTRMTSNRCSQTGQAYISVLSVYTRCKRVRLFTYCESKKQDTKLLPITSPNVNRFKNSFTDRLSGKFAINACLNIPEYHKYVATLPCEMSVFNQIALLKK